MDIRVGDVGTVEDLFVKPVDDDMCVKLLRQREGLRIGEEGEKGFERVL